LALLNKYFETGTFFAIVSFRNAEWRRYSHGYLALTVTHRYLLYQAYSTVVSNAHTKQIAKMNDMSKLLNIRSKIVGQWEACDRVFDLVFAYVAMQKSEPLLLAFAGPAGHGKTELAEQLGIMIGVKSLSISCAEIRTSWGLSGSETGFANHGNGTKLNNFLVEIGEKHAFVLLGEFD
jgi:hypothetical protein